MRSKEEIEKKIEELVAKRGNFFIRDWIWDGKDEMLIENFSRERTSLTLTAFAYWLYGDKKVIIASKKDNKRVSRSKG
jgi:hypothetical protein